jgi:hypothetical protein
VQVLCQTNFVAAIFGDTRLNERACKVIDALGQKPNVSITAALSVSADSEACYRLMDIQKFTPDKVLQPHADATYKRVVKEDYVLMVQETTAIVLTRPQQQVTGAGPMDFETRRGAFIDPMVAFSYAVIFEPSEWKRVYATLGIKFPETECPKLNEVVRAIA